MIDKQRKNYSFTKHRKKKPEGYMPHWGWEAYPFWFVVVMLLLAYGRVFFS